MSNRTPSDRASSPSSPPEAWEPLLRAARIAARPLERFLGVQAASGILLLVAALVALVWANTRWAGGYVALWQTPIGVRLGGVSFERSLAWVVNDALMVVFFFLVGLEIRREIHHGELSEPRRAALPVAAALGGMLVPAALYLAVAGGTPTRAGWGVPMATDIAFALGVLALLGRRVPAAMRVFLLALAVIDDLGAILVIALFYSSGIAWVGLAVAAGGLLGVFVMRWLGVRAKIAYVLPGVVVWAGIYAAGIHPTIAGVLLGLVTPVRVWSGSTEAMSPAESLIETLHPWVAYGVMPVFALANAGVPLAGASIDAHGITAACGVVLGLLVGKPVGVVLTSALAIRIRLGALPVGMTMRHLVVLGMVAGIGFTMSLFVAQLAFDEPATLAAAKLGILVATAVAATTAIVVGRLVLARATADAACTADEAESSTSL